MRWWVVVVVVGGRSQGWVGVRCVGLGNVVVGLGSLVWWASVSVSGGCCVVLCGGGGGRGAKPRVGGCALGVGRCVFRGLGQDFAKMVHFRLSENLENNFRQHVVLLEYLPTRYCLFACLKACFRLSLSTRNKKTRTITSKKHAYRPETSYVLYYSLNKILSGRSSPLFCTLTLITE